MGTFGRRSQDIGLLFITDTVAGWNPLFQDSACAEIVMGSLSFCIEHGRIDLYCYVLMPNHYHLILGMRNADRIEGFLRDFNKFTSQRLLFHLRDTQPQELGKFYIGSRKQTHRIWMSKADIKNVVGPTFLLQKAEYIHNNPLSPKWRGALGVENPWDYPYSSAGFYLRGIEDPFVRLSDFRLLF